MLNIIVGIISLGIVVAMHACSPTIRHSPGHMIGVFGAFLVIFIVLSKILSSFLTAPIAGALVFAGYRLFRGYFERSSPQRPSTKPEGSPDRSAGQNIPRSIGSLSSWTGVITIAEREQAKSTSSRTIMGSSGQIMGMRTETRYSHLVRFRVAMHDEDGQQTDQIAVEANVDYTDIYLQEGDLVTLVGSAERNGALRNPGIINHSARIIMIPSLAGHVGFPLPRLLVFVVWCAVTGTGTLFFAGTRGSGPGPGAAVFALPLGLAFLIGFLPLIYNLVKLILGIFRRRRISRALAQIRKIIESKTSADGSWPKAAYTDPQGTVEGAFLFSRGSTDPVEWVTFRMGIYDSVGNLQDWLVGAMPQSWLATELRKGDLVRWTGTYTSGEEICRPSRVDVL